MRSSVRRTEPVRETIAGIPVELRRKRIKNMHLRIKADGSVVVSAPLKMSSNTIEGFVQAKREWIQKHQGKIEQRLSLLPVAYETGEPLPVWGKTYTIELVHGARNSLELLGDTALLTAREASTPEQRARYVREWYRAQLVSEASVLFDKWEARIGLKPLDWQTKYMTSRWGTCSIQAKRIWLNVRLAEKPRECLEYVTLHELVHLVERGHGDRFKALMDSYLPQWREVRRRLNE